MNAPLLVLVAVGGILIAGTLGAILTASHAAADGLKISFTSDATPALAPAAAEPLFPGMPGQ
jgi:hypothetical protein